MKKATTFATKLQELLTEADMTAYRLSKESGVSEQNLSRILAGQYLPGFEIVVRIAKALNVSLSVFDNVTISPNNKG